MEYYSEFFPPRSDAGTRGTTVPILATTDLEALKEFAKGVADDGIITVDEKIRGLIPLVEQLQDRYNIVLEKAVELGVADDNPMQNLTSKFTAWDSFLATLIEPVLWSNTETFTEVDRETFNTRLSELSATFTAAEAANIPSKADQIYYEDPDQPGVKIPVQDLKPAEGGATNSGNPNAPFGNTGKTIQDFLDGFEQVVIIDSDAPNTPTNLVLSSSVSVDPTGQQDFVLRAAWSAVSATDLAGYVLELQQENGSPVEFVLGPSATNYERNVPANTLFFARVRAFDFQSNYSNYSAQVSHRTGKDTIPPAAPTNLTVETGLTQNFVRWTNPNDSDLAYVEIIEATTATSAGGTVGFTVAVPGSPGGYARTVPAGMDLWYYVRAFDTSGNYSPTVGPVKASSRLVALSDFTPGLTAVGRGTVLPSPIGYNGPKTFFNETDGKLYNYVDGAWKTGVASVDIAGTIAANQLNVKIGGGNLIKNSSFENKQYTGSYGPAPAGFALYTNDGYTGETSSFVTGRRAGKAWRVAWTGNHSQKGFMLFNSGGIDNANIWQAGVTYIFSVYARASGAAIGKKLTTEWNVTPTRSDILNPPLSSEWQRYAFKLNWPASPVESFGYISIEGATANGVAYIDFDDIQVEEGDVLTAYAPALLPGEITGNLIGNEAVTVDNIAPGAVTDVKISTIAAAKVTGQLTDSQIGFLAATKITGQLTNEQLAGINASKLVGEIVSSQIQNISAVKIVGPILNDQIDNIAATKVTGQLADFQIGSLATTKLTGKVTDVQIDTVGATKVTGLLTSDQIESIRAAKIADQISGTQISDNAISSPKILAGSIISSKIAAGAITAEKLLINSVGSALNADPNFEDQTSWYLGSGVQIVQVNDGVAGNKVMQITAVSQSTLERKPVPLDRNKQYRAQGLVRTVGTTNNAVVYMGIALYDSDFNNIQGDGTYWFYYVSGSQIGNSWETRYGTFGAGTSRPFPANAVYMAPILYGNYYLNQTPTTTHQFQNVRIEEVLPGTLIQDGAISTDKISANAITAGKILAGSISAEKLAASAVTADAIAANAVRAYHVQAATITGDKIAANTITARSMVITGGGYLNNDPNISDATNWELTGASILQVPDLPFGNRAIRSNSTGFGVVATDPNYYPIDPTKKYRFRFWARSGEAADGLLYGCLRQFKSPGIPCDANGGRDPYKPGGIHITPTYTEFTAEYGPADFQPGVKFVQLDWLLNYGGTKGWLEICWPRFEEMVAADLIVNGSITADKIAVNAITANKLTVGSRPTSTIGLNIRVDIQGNLRWDSGYIQYVKDDGTYGIWNVNGDWLTGTAGTRYHLFGVINQAALHITTNDTATVDSNMIYLASFVSGTTDLRVASGVGTLIHGDNIVTGTLNANRIVAYSIDADKIATNAITTSKIAALTITGDKIYANAIMADKIDTNAVTADKIAANAVTTVKLDANAVTAQKIAAGAVLTSKLTVAQRPFSLEGVTFSTDASTNRVSWTAGVATYVDNNGTIVKKNIVPSSPPPVTGPTLYIYYYPGNEYFDWANTSESRDDYVIIGAYRGGHDWTPQYGATIVDGSRITTGSIDANKITAGSIDATRIKADSIDGSRLKINARGISVQGIEFSYDRSADVLRWTAGLIFYTSDSGTAVYANISAGGVAGNTGFGNGGIRYIWWPKGANYLATSVDNWTDLVLGDAIIMCQWTGGTNFVANHGGTIVDGDKITTGSVNANRIIAGTIYSELIGANQIKTNNLEAGAVTTNKIAALAVNAGNIAAGAILADKIGAGAITTEKLLIQQPGAAMNADPYIRDPSAWYVSGFQFIAGSEDFGGPAGRYYAQVTTISGELIAKPVPLDQNKTYRLHGWVSGNGIAYVGVDLQTATGVRIGGDGTYWAYPYSGGRPGVGNWVEVSFVFGAGTSRPVPGNARSMAPIAIGNYHGESGYFTALQDLRIEEVLPGTLIKDGVISTNKLSAEAVTAEKIAAGTITGDRLKVGTIEAAYLAVGAVTADKLAVGTRGANLVPPINGPKSGWRKDSFYGLSQLDFSPTVGANNTPSAIMILNGNAGGLQSVAVPVLGGRTYLFRYWVNVNVAQSGGHYAQLWQSANEPSDGYVDYGADTTSYQTPVNSAGIPANTWVQVTREVTIPNGVNFVSLNFYFEAGYSVAYVANVEFYEQQISATIADGAITTPKMIAGTINADRLTAGSITTPLLAANVITADKLSVGTLQRSVNNLFNENIWSVNTSFSASTAGVAWNQYQSNSWQQVVGPSGGMDLAILATQVVEGAGGGWDMWFPTETSGFSHRKSYRHYTWVKRFGAGGSVYLGTQGVVELDGTTNENPYHIAHGVANLPELNKWYLMVGVVHGSGYTGSHTGVGGIYDPSTGRKVVNANDFKWKTTTTQGHTRAYQYYANIGDQMYFLRPVFEEIRPGLPSVASLLEGMDYAKFINGGSTQIGPGVINVSGTTTLADWRQGGDTTKIAGGAISANTISANKLTIGNRGISIQGIDFSYNRNTGNLDWTTGLLFYVNDAGAPTYANIAPGSVAPGFGSGGIRYIWWSKGSGNLSTSVDNWPDLVAGDVIIMATWTGGTAFVANYGGTIIDGDRITTGSIDANRIKANTILAETIQIGGRGSVGSAFDTAIWSGIGGVGKPVDNAGRVTDDDRVTVQPPSYYYAKGRGEYHEFKNEGWAGTPAGGYTHLLTTVQYQNSSGGPVKQTLTDSNGKVYVRTGYSTWGDWANDYNGFNKPRIGTDLVDSVGSAVVERKILNNEDGIIRAPGGGLFTSQLSQYQGSLAISLPTATFTDSMLLFYVDIFEYIQGYSCTMMISGYTYNVNGGTWYNCTARVLGGSNVEYPVYFGRIGTRPTVFIGDAADTWSYPQVRVRDALIGYNYTSRAVWEDGWNISFQTVGPQNITTQVLDTYPGADWRKLTGAGKPQDYATVGAPADTSVAGQLAQNVALWSSDPAMRVNEYTTTISGGKITTGTIEANRIVSGAIFTQDLYLGNGNFRLAGSYAGYGQGAMVVQNNGIEVIKLGWVNSSQIGFQLKNNAGEMLLDNTFDPRELISDQVTFNMPDITVPYTYQGTPVQGALPFTVYAKRMRGNKDVTAQASWSAGTAQGCTFTVSGNALQVTAVASTGSAEIVSVYNGITVKQRVFITKQVANPPSGGGGSGGTGGTTATTTYFNGPTSTSYSSGPTSDTLRVKAGSGGYVDLTCYVDFQIYQGSGQSGQYGKWRWRAVGGTWADVNSEVYCQALCYKNQESGGNGQPVLIPNDPDTPGYTQINTQKSGLTAGTEYEFGVFLRCTDWPQYSNGTATAEGK